MRWLTRIGLILVAVGVVGEWRYGSKLEDTHNDIHTLDVAELTAAQIMAGDAATSATTAHNEADAAKKEIDLLTPRLNSASNKLVDIEQDIFALGPRWRLLEYGKDVFIKAIKPFAGQRVTVVTCGNM